MYTPLMLPQGHMSSPKPGTPVCYLPQLLRTLPRAPGSPLLRVVSHYQLTNQRQRLYSLAFVEFHLLHFNVLLFLASLRHTVTNRGDSYV